jgi:hypothetical protein
MADIHEYYKQKMKQRECMYKWVAWAVLLTLLALNWYLMGFELVSDVCRAVVFMERRPLMASYIVVWEIDVEADSHEKAAEEALRIQRDKESTATVFKVIREFGDTFIVDVKPDESEVNDG